MKKIIVIFMLLMAATCYAGIVEDIFESTSTVDITKFKAVKDNSIYGITSLQASEFIILTKKVIDNNKDYQILQHFTEVNGSVCIAMIDSDKIYAMCLHGVTVLVREIKL